VAGTTQVVDEDQITDKSEVVDQANVMNESETRDEEDERPSQEGKITGKGFSDIMHVNMHTNNGSLPNASPSFLRAANIFWDYLVSS
jgi:hypothetical protein